MRRALAALRGLIVGLAVCLSLPVMLSDGEIQGRVLPKLTDDELKKLQFSGESLKKVIEQLSI